MALLSKAPRNASVRTLTATTLIALPRGQFAFGVGQGSGEFDAVIGEEDGQRVMKQSEITVRVNLGRGTASDTVWTCDLSHDYVSINADYRS